MGRKPCFAKVPEHWCGFANFSYSCLGIPWRMLLAFVLRIKNSKLVAKVQHQWSILYRTWLKCAEERHFSRQPGDIQPPITAKLDGLCR